MKTLLFTLLTIFSAITAGYAFGYGFDSRPSSMQFGPIFPPNGQINLPPYGSSSYSTFAASPQLRSGGYGFDRFTRVGSRYGYGFGYPGGGLSGGAPWGQIYR